MKFKHLFLGVVICLSIFTSCTGGYSFTGASIPVDAKTISIHSFSNNARLVQPQLSQVLTDDLRSRFMRQTSLVQVDYDGDLELSGEIIDYTTTPMAIQGDDQAARNRLTIVIKVKFVNRKDPKANFEETFSRNSDYPSQSNLLDEEEGLIKVISEKLVDDIFQKSVANW